MAKTQYTKEMLAAMSKSISQKRSMMIEILNRTQYLTKKDIGAWHRAWQQAIRVDYPSRAQLYDIYTQLVVDLHLSGCINQRMGMVKKKAFKLVDREGKENLQLTELLESEWFKDYMDYVLESRYFGHSLVEFGDVIKTPQGAMKFSSATLIPRKHVVPEHGVILRHDSDCWQHGISYRDGDITSWCIEAGKPTDLGLLHKCAPSVLSKKNMLAYWDAWGEMFGMPIRIGKTQSRDPKDREEIEAMLSEMGAAAWGLFPDGTEIDIVESTKSDAYMVYDKRVDRANSEISKVILGQTMTIDSGSSLSQSEVHLEVLGNIIDSDADFLRDNINNRLLPLMIFHGFKVEGYRFEWDEAVEYSPQEQINIEQMILNSGYDIAPDYFTQKYNIPILEKKEKETQNFFD